MPINVAMEEPRAWVVCIETESHVVAGLADIDDITPDWVSVVVRRAACDTDDVKSVAVKVERVLVIWSQKTLRRRENRSVTHVKTTGNRYFDCRVLRECVD